MISTPPCEQLNEKSKAKQIIAELNLQTLLIYVIKDVNIVHRGVR